MLKPDGYFERITDIDIKFLEKFDIKGLILDVDNTLIDLEQNMLAGVTEWVNLMKQNNIEIPQKPNFRLHN